MACDPNALAAAASQFQIRNTKLSKAIFVRLLCAAVDGETMACDPNTLANEAKCFVCLDETQLDAIMIYLMCQLVEQLSA